MNRSLLGPPPYTALDGSSFTSAQFTAAFPSAWWEHFFLGVGDNDRVWNVGQAGMDGQITYAQSPNNNIYRMFNWDQNEEAGQFATAYFSMPWNWKASSGLKIRHYWFTTVAVFGNIDWEISIRSIGNTETIRYNQTYTTNNDTAAAIDTLYISDELSYTPYTDGSALAVNDFFGIMFRRGNDGVANNATRSLGVRLSWEIDPTIAVP